MDPVIVVGAGPVGLALALSLARHEVPSVVLDETAGEQEQRPARTVVLHQDTAALVERIAGASVAGRGTYWSGWRSLRRRQVMSRITFGPEEPAPLHIAQHALTAALRSAATAHPLVEIATDSRLDALEQESTGVTAHTRGPRGTWWHGSHLVGCDGARSTVRKLLDVRFPGRTGVERYAVAALRAELPWPGEAVLHRSPPWRLAGSEVAARPLGDDLWRLDWLLAQRGDLVTPDVLVTRIRETLAGWNHGPAPAYELLDTGVHTVHHRLARRWRAGRVFLAGDAAHLLGALGTQGIDEGLRDVANLAWKLSRAWHHGHHEALLDSYQTERRAAVAARLRAADQALPILRGAGGLRGFVPGTARGHDTLLIDAHLGRGPLGAPASFTASPLAPEPTGAEVQTATEPGAPVLDVRVTADDGSFVQLRDRLDRGRLIVVLVAPGTGVWARKHWVGAGIMPRLAASVAALPYPAELLVAEDYPGAAAHTVLLVRPDGHLVTALGGVHPDALYAAAQSVLGGAAHTRDAQDAQGPGRRGGPDGGGR